MFINFNRIYKFFGTEVSAGVWLLLFAFIFTLILRVLTDLSLGYA